VSEFEGRVVVITGAASGIGRALAVDLAGRGAALALSDVDTVGLAETARLASSLGAEVKSDHLDVTQREADLLIAEGWAEAVANHPPPAHSNRHCASTSAPQRRSFAIAVGYRGGHVLTHATHGGTSPRN
jgi:NAD(P)-dependent dehydrogenase (short-subunit alcohol dehydrogenase family)